MIDADLGGDRGRVGDQPVEGDRRRSWPGRWPGRRRTRRRRPAAAPGRPWPRPSRAWRSAASPWPGSPAASRRPRRARTGASSLPAVRSAHGGSASHLGGRVYSVNRSAGTPRCGRRDIRIGRVPDAASARGHRALKYFASGWWTTSASVDCSGCSCSSSDSSTPIRSGPQQVDQLGPVLQVGAGRVAERVARAAVRLVADHRVDVAVVGGRSRGRSGSGRATSRPAPRSAGRSARAAPGSPGRRCARTARRSPWRPPRPW